MSGNTPPHRRSRSAAPRSPTITSCPTSSSATCSSRTWPRSSLTNQDDIYSTEVKVGDDGRDQGRRRAGRRSTRARSSGSRPTYKGGEKTRDPDPRDEQDASAAAQAEVADVHRQDRSADPEQVVGDAGLSSSGSTRRRSRTSTSTSTTRRTSSSCACAPRAWAVTCGASTRSSSSRSPTSTASAASSSRSASIEDAHAAQSFTPRMSSAAIVKKVTVKGWNPETKELITGESAAQTRQLGTRERGRRRRASSARKRRSRSIIRSGARKRPTRSRRRA